LQVAFEKMDEIHSGYANIANLDCIQYSMNFLQLRRVDVLPNTANGEVRRECAFFLFIA